MNLKLTQVSEHGRLIEVTVSRTNLTELLRKLNGVPPDSSLTIYRDTEFGRLNLRAEEDAEHYHSRDRDEVARGIRDVTYSEHLITGRVDDVPVPAQDTIALILEDAKECPEDEHVWIEHPSASYGPPGFSEPTWWSCARCPVRRGHPDDRPIPGELRPDDGA